MQPASTPQPLRVPALRERDAWAGRATPELVGIAVTRALVQCGAKADHHSVSELSALVASRGYSPAELAYAAQELPFDNEVDWKKKQGQNVTAADFERVIGAMRRMRASMSMQLRLIDVNKLVMDNPSLLSVDDFEITNYTDRNEPLYRYRYSEQPRHLPATPVLPESAPVERQREGSGTFTIHELVKSQTKQEAA